MTNLSLNLAEAWADRARAAATELQAAEKAPALFKPERVEQLVRDYGRSQAMARYWLGTGA